ncbi:TetR/AcrR family transcriptional regulator [Nocardia aurantia]|uniref:TetR/AcrR family transcriptional regulator n=1 Tax=Nocardia aurantia TaxID=2585199 RepID=UPI0018861F92|nr:TetR/AcrR family transcriptional regulator [Nocardia aurantia]
MTEGNPRSDGDPAAPPVRRGSRGKYAKSAERRRAIVLAAIEVFSKSGFRDGSLRDVAEKVGITHPGIRHHFPTKSDLLQAVLRWREDEALAKANRVRLDGIDVVHAWIAAVADNVQNPTLIELEFALAGEASSAGHPAHGHFARLYTKSEEILHRAFAVMRDRGQLRDGTEPALAARAMLACTQGVQALWLRDRRIDIAEVLQAQLTVLLRDPLASKPVQ